jgi:hypothetical protein
MRNLLAEYNDSSEIPSLYCGGRGAASSLGERTEATKERVGVDAL